MTHQDSQLLDALEKFFNDYHREDLLETANDPGDNPSIDVRAKDVYRYDPDLLDDWTVAPEQITNHAEEAVSRIDLPVDHGVPTSTSVRLIDPDDYLDTIGVPDVQRANVGELEAVKGQINQITPERPLVREAAFVCQICGTVNWEEQSFHDTIEPAECNGCERQGPFKPDWDKSEDVPYLRLQLKQPPEDAGQGTGQDATVHILGDLCDYGGENGIHDHAGERVTVYGRVDADESSFGEWDAPTYEKDLHANSIELEEDVDVDYTDDLDRIREMADGVEWDVPDYVEVEPSHPAWALAHSLAPGLKLDLRLAQVGLGTMVYLAGSYRMDGGESADYRGEIHMGSYGDPGTGKSTYATAADAMSPMSMRATGPDLSKVGLTAAAVRDDFGGDQWTLSPGVLPKSHGGHAIVEEIDKMDSGDTDALHDALEYPQRIDVSKAGMNATLKTEAALYTTGNPEEGSFHRGATIGEQIGINDALITRFDLIFCLWDRVDERGDADIADHILQSMSEASKEERAESGFRDEFEAELSDTPVDVELIPKWIAACRDRCKPELPAKGEVVDILRDWYVDTRQENGEGGQVPITARSLEAGVRLSIAFARLRLSDVVEPCDARLAIHLSKRVMGDIFLDPETGDFDATRQYKPDQKSRKERIKRYIRKNPECSAEEIAEDTGIDIDWVERDVDKLLQKGMVIERNTDAFEVV